MEFRQNNLTKSSFNENTNNYILKVNSKDRNIIKEPNPFNFKIKFNQTTEKYTTYFENGYFGSGGKWINNNSGPHTTWNNTSSYYNKTFRINNGAVIEDSLQDIKDINVTEIVAPRYIPDEHVGYKIDYLEAMANPIDPSGIFLRGYDNTVVKYIEDDAGGNTYKFFKITDNNAKIFYLFSDTDLSNGLHQDIKKNYYLYNDYYTDTLNLNNTLYKIRAITNGYIKLATGDNESSPMDFLKTEVRLSKYYSDTIWYEPSNTFDNIKINASNEVDYIKIDQSGESLLTVDFVKGSIIEIGEKSNLIDNYKYHYLEITSADHLMYIESQYCYNNVTFVANTKKIIIDKLTNSEIQKLVSLENIKHIDITSTSNNNNCFTVNKIQQIGSCKIEIIVSENVVDETPNTTNILFKKSFIKTYPYINFTDSEHAEINTFLSDSNQSEVTNTIMIKGKWQYNGKPNGGSNYYSLTHLKHGIKDLLNEKLFYLNLESIAPSKNLITNGKLNNVIGTFYPSTQSKHYIFLTGHNRQRFTHRNLQNIRDLHFKLYYMDGTQVGTTFENYGLDYLERDCKQTNLTFLIDQVDRHFS